MNAIKQRSCRVTQLWFERGSTCKRMCYIAPCNSINILTLAQKLQLPTLVGARRSGKAQKVNVLNKDMNCNLTSCYTFLYLQNWVLTYLLTPWSRVLLEKLTGSAASQEIPRIFGTRRFITVLTSVRHLSLSSANSIQSPQPPPIS